MDTRKVKNPSEKDLKDEQESMKLASMLNAFCAHLAKKSFSQLKPPYPKQYRGLGDINKIIIIVDFEREDIALPNNTKALILNEAKKYFRNYPEYKKIKFEVQTSTQSALQSMKAYDQADQSESALENETNKKAVTQFASNLADLSNQPTLINDAFSKSTLKESILFLRSYFINKILEIHAMEEKFFVTNRYKEGDRVSGVLSAAFELLQIKIVELGARVKQAQDRYHFRTLQFVTQEYSRIFPKVKPIVTILHGEIDGGKINAEVLQLPFLDYPNVNGNDYLAIQAWSLLSTEAALRGDYLTFLKKCDAQLKSLMTDWLSPCLVLIQRIQSGLKHIDLEAHVLLMGELLDASIYSQSQSMLDEWSRKQKENELLFVTIEKNLAWLEQAQSLTQKKILEQLALIGQAHSSSATVSTSQFALLPSPAATNQAYELRSSSMPSSKDAPVSFDYIGKADIKSSSDYKKEAQERIQHELFKRKNHRDDVVNDQSAMAQSKASVSKPAFISLQIKQGIDECKIIQANLFSGTTHLYVSFDLDIFPRDQFIDFKTIGQTGKILMQDNLGHNGMKIYGLNCMAVKCKKHKGDRLLCIAHLISGTNNYVYLPYEIISHKKYLELLHDKKLLDQMAQKARLEITITPVLDNVVAPRLKQ